MSDNIPAGAQNSIDNEYGHILSRLRIKEPAFTPMRQALMWKEGAEYGFNLAKQYAPEAARHHQSPVRPVVKWFAEQMELKLSVNDHKGGWLNDTEKSLLKRLKEETKELIDLFEWRKQDVGRSASEGVMFKDVSNEAIVKECADIANFAMMIADLYAKEIGDEHPSSLTGDAVEDDEGIMDKWIDCRTKAMSKMLDNPYSNGIYRTSDFFDTIDTAFIDLFKTWHNKLSYPPVQIIDKK